jgi:hypothetical protein
MSMSAGDIENSLVLFPWRGADESEDCLVYNEAEVTIVSDGDATLLEMRKNMGNV